MTSQAKMRPSHLSEGKILPKTGRHILIRQYDFIG